MRVLYLAATAATIMFSLGTAPASALTMKECSTKYQAAKEADTLNGMNWTAFRKAECAAADTDAAATDVNAGVVNTGDAAATTQAKTAFVSFKECGTRYQEAKRNNELNGRGWDEYRTAECGHSLDKKEAKASSNPAQAPAGVTFPTEIAADFKDETPSKARMHSCLKQYHANKEAGTLNGLRWIQKGGGYYSICSKRLKGDQAA
ncbi:antifreeze protein [Mesorhizobium sp. NPDC059054]|uniref:antifreeze protein n=1 Tax=Mesorhizobium sp. NPDC059054 TaxID=3346711 RepID=UPI00367F2CFE